MNKISPKYIALNQKMDDYNKIALIIAAYAVVQISAQGLGLKTGKRQRDLIQTEPISFAILYSVSFLFTDDYQIALAGTVIYYFLKYFYSQGVTSDVCTESV